MTRSNDFTDRAAYILQQIIPEAISKVRDNGGKTPLSVRRFLYDKLKFNDNSNNEVRYSSRRSTGYLISNFDSIPIITTLRP